MATQARVPIIPVFTQNIREAFRTVQLGRNFFRRIYDKYKFPLMAIYGGFPVKLKTIVGEPIYVDPQLSVEEIADQVSCRFVSIRARYRANFSKFFHFPHHVFVSRVARLSFVDNSLCVRAALSHLTFECLV